MIYLIVISIFCLFHQATNEIVTRVPKSTPDEMQAAVDAASAAYETWSRETVMARQQIMFKYQALIKENLVKGQLKAVVCICSTFHLSPSNTL